MFKINPYEHHIVIYTENQIMKFPFIPHSLICDNSFSLIFSLLSKVDFFIGKSKLSQVRIGLKRSL